MQWLTLLIICAGLVAFGLWQRAHHGDEFVVWIEVVPALSLLVLPVYVVAHELGHALSSIAVRIPVVRVEFGLGWTIIYRARWRGCDFVFRTVPFGGYSLSAFATNHLLRQKYYLIVLGGPLMNALLISGLIMLRLRLSGGGLAALLVDGSIMSNVLMLLFSLFSRRNDLNVGIIPSDGMLLLMLPGYSEAQVRQLHTAGLWSHGIECLERADDVGAERWFNKGLCECPGSLDCRIGLAMVALERGEFDDARTRLLQCLEATQEVGDLRAKLLNEIAWVDLSSASPRRLEEADRLSFQALAECPWDPEFKGTRGCVLTQRGRFEEAIPLLRVASRHCPRRMRARAMAYLAVSLSNLGKKGEAAQYLRRAGQLDPTFQLGLLETTNRINS